MGDVFCDICGRRWDAQDPEVLRFWSEHVWECRDESLCLERKAMNTLAEEVARDADR
jgi:hypothetical protein